jgi:hypothetical protein
MPKRFTLAEAQSLVPEVSRRLREAVALKAEFEQAEGAFRSSTERIMAMGGVTVDRESVREFKVRRESAAARLPKAIERIQQIGCVVKDLDIGLVDFPTLFRGLEVYLCWRLGEPDIRFWHGVDEGFAHRKPIDQDFRDHHRGDLEQ